MANRIVLNETSYHGAGAIAEIANEAKTRAFKTMPLTLAKSRNRKHL